MHHFSVEHLLAFIMFAVVSSVTPGPNNIMIMSSGLNYGPKRSLPHLFGICLGFGFMVFATGIGLHSLFLQSPWMQMVLKYVGAAYLFWLALRIGMSGNQLTATSLQGRPLTFLEAAIFQWINPKAWVIALGALTAFLPTPSAVVDVAILAGVYSLVGLPCVAVWGLFGFALRKLMDSPAKLRIFNWTTAILLMASIYPMVAG
ncbi:LysE family translocator [Methylobacillus arboreus]|uniref:LysE family translocator n=1 Tax=Methylobacillus arboreus TaxID=755170 RepID=UPI001E356DD5|nr:LysE family translocator [Methylobacillus arboreus]MCB5189783.1 LysE family translocator [Methylobacillus arboreus]